ncbi:MAG: methyltransferase domain-containing protein [Hyphomonadaceae bacterium]
MANRAVNFIGAELAAQTKVDAPNQVSDHAYNYGAQQILKATEQKGGMALDCGAGSRTYTSENLVQVEITPYDNIDVLAVNQSLPFADDSFDAVISLDVLEHVSDPFASAREIARVLKPGGILFVDVPFMQVEHGYPHHYFNMTRMGLRQLFEGLLDCKAHVVPRSGHPAHVVWSTLQSYRVGLSKAERAEFDSFTVAEIMAMGHIALRDLYEANFSEAATWKMASTTQALFAKPWDQEQNRLGLEVSKIGAFRPYKKNYTTKLQVRAEPVRELPLLQRVRLFVNRQIHNARSLFSAE